MFSKNLFVQILREYIFKSQPLTTTPFILKKSRLYIRSEKEFFISKRKDQDDMASYQIWHINKSEIIQKFPADISSTLTNFLLL